MVFSRSGLILALLALQILFIFFAFDRFRAQLPIIYDLLLAFTVLMVLYLLNGPMDPTAKITWLVLVMLMPVFGTLLFLFTQKDIGHRTLRDRYAAMGREMATALRQSPEEMEALEEDSPGAAALARYVNRSASHPVYGGTSVAYFPLGEDAFAAMLTELRKAERFIFLEFFIVAEGDMWGRTLEVLAEKAKAGVDVRMLYDGSCELSTLPHNYPAMLERLGIRCKMFAPFKPFVSTHYNYRDHRKILVVDGQVAFTGGVNLADEYINAIDRFGHWKDTAVMVDGPAAASFTRMFLHMWSMDERKPDWERFLAAAPIPRPGTKGFVMPYGDCPVDNDKVGEQVYIDILYRARDHVHIMTPYLILDGEMENALRFAAERGVGVQIILPGVPDKKIPYALALTHYRSLLESGVEIFEYTPGFVHAKVFASDWTEAVVGTINLDYRSLYHHFECALFMRGVPCVAQIEEDFVRTRARCRQIRLQDLAKQPFGRKALGFLAKTVAPLL